MTARETERGIVVTLPSEGRTAQVAAAVDRLVASLARHWLAAFNAVVAIFIALPFLAPTLLHLAATADCVACTRAGRLIYTIYSPTCHQLPERSFFLFGPQTTYSVTQLEAIGALPPGMTIWQRELLRFIGTPEIGFKVAFCERDVAIYVSILLSGLLFGLLRGRLRPADRPLPKLPLWGYALLLVPLAIDGGMQLIGWRESTWPSRLITGALFGAATVWLAYPYVQDAMDDVLRSTVERLTSLAKQPPQTGQKPPVGV